MTNRPASPGAPSAGFLVTLTLAMLVSTFMQFAVGVLGPFLLDDFGIARTQLGLLTTVLFLTGALSAPVLGRLADMVSPDRMLRGLFIWSGLTFALFALSPTYALLIATVLLAGISSGAGNPLTNKLVAGRVAPGRQGAVMGVKQSGVLLGNLACGALLPVGALYVGWRVTMGVAGALAAVAFVVLPRFAVRPETHPETVTPTGEASPDRKPSAVVRWLAPYALLMGAGGAVVYAFLPLYAHEQLGFSVQHAGWLAAFTALVGIIARVGWGVFGDRIAIPAKPLAYLAGVAVLGQLLIAVSALGVPWLAWGGAVLFGASAGSWNSIGMLAIIKELDRAVAGRVSGWVQMAFSSGYLLSPVAFGYAADVTGSYFLGWMGSAALFLVALAVSGLWWTRHVAAGAPLDPKLRSAPGSAGLPGGELER